MVSLKYVGNIFVLNNQLFKFFMLIIYFRYDIFVNSNRCWNIFIMCTSTAPTAPSTPLIQFIEMGCNYFCFSLSLYLSSSFINDTNSKAIYVLRSLSLRLCFVMSFFSISQWWWEQQFGRRYRRTTDETTAPAPTITKTH